MLVLYLRLNDSMWKKKGSSVSNVAFQGLHLSVALVRERTIPTERPPPVGEVGANFCG